ncbi:hypothetical protein FRC06_002189 [Ceratobasidium sp. 370]|nr:hypothetical protein FRC06_002189 [Ceratobasidium sp. 370]
MVAIIPVVLGTLAALYVTLINPAEPPYLQSLTAVVMSGIGSVNAIHAFIGRRRHVNPQPMASLLHSFNRQILAALPSVFSVLDEITPYSGPLALAVADAVTSSHVVAPCISDTWNTLTSAEAKVWVWLEPRANDFDFDPWFEWRSVHETGDSVMCSQDGFDFRLTCYRFPRSTPRVRSLDVYQPNMKELVVFSQTRSLQACLPYEPLYRYHSRVRSINVYGRGTLSLTTMGRVILVQPPSLPMSLASSDSKALAVYNHTPSLQVHLPEEILARFYSSVAVFVFRQVRFVPICALAAVCVLVIGILVGQGLAVTNVASDPVQVPSQEFYKLVLDDVGNIQGEEPKYSLIPLPLDTTYNGYERDQGPDDDVSGICGLDSHSANAVVSETSTVTVTSSGTSYSHSNSDLATTLSVDPAWVPLPCSEGDDLGLAEDVAPPSTDAHSAGDATDVGTGELSSYESQTFSGRSTGIGGGPELLVEDDGATSTFGDTSLNSDILDGLANAEQERPTDADLTVDMTMDMSVGNTGTSIGTSLGTVTPGLGAPSTGTARASGLPTEDSLDLHLGMKTGSRLLGVNLNDLGHSLGGLISDFDQSEDDIIVPQSSAPPTGTANNSELSTKDLLDPGLDMHMESRLLDVDLDGLGDSTDSLVSDTVSKLNALPTGTADPSGLPNEDSLDLNLGMETRSRLLDIDQDDLGNSVGDTTALGPSAPPTGAASFVSLSNNDSLNLGLDTTMSRLLDVDLNDLGNSVSSLVTEHMSEDYLDLNPDVGMESQLLDIDLNALEDLVPDVGQDEGDRPKPRLNASTHAALPSSGSDKSLFLPRLLACHNRLTIAEESFDTLANLSPNTTASEPNVSTLDQQLVDSSYAFGVKRASECKRKAPAIGCRAAGDGKKESSQAQP